MTVAFTVSAMASGTEMTLQDMIQKDRLGVKSGGGRGGSKGPYMRSKGRGGGVKSCNVESHVFEPIVSVPILADDIV